MAKTTTRKINEWCPLCGTENAFKFVGMRLYECAFCGFQLTPCSMCRPDEVKCEKCKLSKRAAKLNNLISIP